MSVSVNGCEIPVVFDCLGEQLVGVVHRPDAPGECGVLTVVAGGPQYRAGMGRGLVSMGRALSSSGIPVMRFDHRGLGDSAGRFLGFEHMEADLCAAVAAFRSQVPELRKVVLWGGCDAASGIMIHARNVPGVSSIVLGNPFVTSSETQAAVVRQHYLKRLGERSFWRKALRFEYKPLDYVTGVVAKLRQKLLPSRNRADGSPATARDNSFIGKMLMGLQHFDGPVLFVMSGQSLVSKEFDELVARSPAWKAAYDRPGNERVDLPEADQAFSSQDAKERVNAAVSDWVERLGRAD